MKGMWWWWWWWWGVGDGGWGGWGGVGMRGCSEMMYSPTCIKQALRNKQVLTLFKTDAYLIQVQFNVIAFFMELKVCLLNTGCLLNRGDQYDRFHCT